MQQQIDTCSMTAGHNWEAPEGARAPVCSPGQTSSASTPSLAAPCASPDEGCAASPCGSPARSPSAEGACASHTPSSLSSVSPPSSRKASCTVLCGHGIGACSHEARAEGASVTMHFNNSWHAPGDTAGSRHGAAAGRGGGVLPAMAAEVMQQDLQAPDQAAVMHAADAQHSLGARCETSGCSLCSGPFGCAASSEQRCSAESVEHDGGVTSTHWGQLDAKGVVRMLSGSSSDEGHILLN